MGLRPNIGIRGTSPDRSKKITLMEDGILFGPAPYAAPAAYYFPLITRMELVRVIKGPGAISFGPQTVGGAIDFVTRAIPADETGAVDVAVGGYGYGKAARLLRRQRRALGLRHRGRPPALDGLQGARRRRRHRLREERVDVEGALPARRPIRSAFQTIGPQARLLRRGLARELPRPHRRRLPRQPATGATRASRFDRMQYHRTQIVATYHARFAARVHRSTPPSTATTCRARGARSTASARPAPSPTILASPDSPAARTRYCVLTGACDTTIGNLAARRQETIYIGPNRREFVSQGAQVVGGWQGRSGAGRPPGGGGVRYHYDRIDRLHTEDGFWMRTASWSRTASRRSPRRTRARGSTRWRCT